MPALRSTRSSSENKKIVGKPRYEDQFEEEAQEFEEEEEVDVEVDDEEEEEAETRCICEQLDPPDENGLFIQCEKCHVWQHGFCVSITDIVPEKYWCELCKPELHTIVIRPDGKITKYLPVQPRESSNSYIHSQSSSKKKSKKSTGKDVKREDDSSTPGKKKRERSTLNSREDARYEALIQRVMEESKKDAQPDKNGGDVEEDEDDEDSETHGLKRRRRTQHDAQDEPSIKPSIKTEESRDLEGSSHNDSENDEHIGKSEGDSSTRSSTKQDHDAQDIFGRSREISDPASDTSHSSSKQEKQSPPPQQQQQQQQQQQHQQQQQQHHHQHHHQHQQQQQQQQQQRKRNKKPASKDKTTAIDFNKPTKPRLPQLRSTMNEMRKRVAAILEFIGRTQIDIANEQKDHDELTKFIEDELHKVRIKKLFENYNGSLEIMDGLTRSLLIWEQKFGKYGEK